MSLLRRLLVHVGDSDLDEPLVRFAARLAMRHDARLHAVHAVEPFSRGAFLSPQAAMAAVEAQQHLMRERDARARQRVHDACQAVGCAAEFTPSGGEPMGALARRTHTTDLVIVLSPGASDDDAMTPGFVSQLVVRSGCPVLFVPSAALEESCGDRVLVAWAGTRESARALRDALPLLHGAAGVEVLHFGAESGERHDDADPLDAVTGYLAAHGVQASTVHRVLREPPFSERMLVPNAVDASVAELLLSHAADTVADLIVMGGYGHTRALELVLGGVTRSMLSSMTVPVLMSH